MNILISAFNCSPYEGSECALGWNWIYQYSIHAKEDDYIYVVANKAYKATMEKAIREYGLDNVTLWFPEESKNLKLLRIPGIPRILRIKSSLSTSSLLYRRFSYAVWQKYAYRCVKKYVEKQGIHFDLIHHVSKAAWWWPGEFWKYKDAHTIFGPVGGGQEIPKVLISYQPKRFQELVRILGNRTRKLNPWFRRAINSFDRIYAANDETLERLKTIVDEEKILVEPDIAVPKQFLNEPINRDHNTHRFLFVGRYDLARKGALFLLDCLEYLPDDFEYTIDFVGGIYDQEIKEKAAELRLEDRVWFRGRIPYVEMKDLYKQYDALLFTSLRETSGNVTYEAMASGLPVVGFNTSINRMLTDCGIFIDVDKIGIVDKRNLKTIQTYFANAMVGVFERYDHYSSNAYSYALNHTWEDKYLKIIGDSRVHIKKT